MKINLRSLSRVISQKLGIAECKVEEILKTFIEEVSHRIRGGDRVHIKGFGTFFMKSRKGREVMNPQTRQMMQYNDVTVPRVKFSSIFKKIVRRGGDK